MGNRLPVPETVHHLVPTSRGGERFDPRNRKLMRENRHVAFHVVFDNLTPDEQIARILEINSTALRREFGDKVRRLLERGDDWIYEDGIFVRK